MEKQVHELQQEVLTRDARRPVLIGEPEDGDAWDFYQRAFKGLADKGLSSLLSEFHHRSPKADRIKVDAALAAHAGSLEYLRRGARCGQARYRFHAEFEETIFRNELDYEKPAWGRPYLVMMIAACKARALREEGSTRDSAELLLDLCQFGRDLSHDSMFPAVILGLTAEKVAFDELKDVLTSGQLSRDDLLRIESGLGALDAGWPSISLMYVNEVAVYGNALLTDAYLTYLDPRAVHLAKGGWRYGWSDRLMKADAFGRSLEWSRKAGLLEGRPWKDERDAWDQALQEMNKVQEKMVNLPIALSPIKKHGYYRVARERRTHLRLLRTAVHFVATGEKLVLADPFGDQLQLVQDGGTLRVWSVGIDGTGNGKGDWENPHDFVLEVKR